MKQKIIELRRKQAALVTEERAQLDRLKREGKTFDATETEQYEKRAKDIGDLDAEIQQLETLEQRDAENRERGERLSKLQTDPEKPNGGTKEKPANDIEMRAFTAVLAGGFRALDSLTPDERRSLTIGKDDTGGYLQTPQQFVNQLLKGVDDIVFMRNLATKYSIGESQSLGVPTLDTDVTDAEWTSELATGSEDTTGPRFGKRELRPHPLAKRIKISKKLLRPGATVMPVEEIVRERFAYKFGLTEEKAFLTGDGNMKPLGVFTASNDGIGTTRDVSTDNTTTAITADGLINAKHALKVQYWNDPSLRWNFHRDAIKMIRKLKDGQGQYLWQSGISSGLPASILEVPYVLSENTPATFTTGLYVGMIGAWRYYWIADCMAMTLQVLTELYAETNQNGYIARAEVDGMPVLAEAFVRVKLA